MAKETNFEIDLQTLRELSSKLAHEIDIEMSGLKQRAEQFDKDKAKSELEQIEAQLDVLSAQRCRIERIVEYSKSSVQARDEGSPYTARATFREHWMQLVELIPEERLDLLLGLRLRNTQKGTGTQTLIAWFEKLRKDVSLLASAPDQDKSLLRKYVRLLERDRFKIEENLEARRFDEAWATLRGLWEERIMIVPNSGLLSELEALTLLVEKAHGKNKKQLSLAIKRSNDLLKKEKFDELRGHLAWIKRELNEEAQTRYWRYDIYQRRVTKTAKILGVSLAVLVLSIAALTGLPPPSPPSFWATSIRTLLSLLTVVLSGGIGGAVGGLRASGEMNERSLSGAYFRQAVSYLRMMIGAAAALAVYFLFASGLLTINVNTGVSEYLLYPALGFLAGFSGKFFVSSVKRAEALATPEEEPAGEEDGDDESRSRRSRPT